MKSLKSFEKNALSSKSLKTIKGGSVIGNMIEDWLTRNFKKAGIPVAEGIGKR